MIAKSSASEESRYCSLCLCLDWRLQCVPAPEQFCKVLSGSLFPWGSEDAAVLSTEQFEALRSPYWGKKGGETEFLTF